jgi:hypothetical protein
MVLGNPAQRLHDILAAFESSATTAKPLADCWRHTFKCTDEELPACLASALGLIPEIRTRIESQAVDQLAVYNRWVEAWREPFMPHGRNWDQASHGLVDEDAMLALTSLSAIFGALEPRVVIVEAEQSEHLLGLVAEARAAVIEADDLPPELRAAVRERLHDVQWALEHYQIHGAAGLQSALDRLGVELVRTAKYAGGWRRRVGTLLVVGLLALGHAEDVVSNLEAVGTIAHEVVEWKQDAIELVTPEHPALPVAPPPADAVERSGQPEDVVDAEIVEEDRPDVEH